MELVKKYIYAHCLSLQIISIITFKNKMYCWQYLPISREMLTMQYIDLTVFQNKVTQITPMFVFLTACVRFIAAVVDETTSDAALDLSFCFFTHTESKSRFSSDFHNIVLIGIFHFQTALILIPILVDSMSYS